MYFQAGVQIGDPVKQVFNGQEVEVWPRIVWKPKWGLMFSEVKRKVSGTCTISQNSTLVIKGRNVVLKDLSLDGALIVDPANDAEVNLHLSYNLYTTTLEHSYKLIVIGLGEICKTKSLF